MNNKQQESFGVIKNGKLGIFPSMDLLGVLMAHHRDTGIPIPQSKLCFLRKLRFEYQDVYWNSRLQEEPLDLARAFSLLWQKAMDGCLPSGDLT